MIRINVKTNTERKLVVKTLNSTPLEVLKEVGADVNKCTATIDGETLNASKLTQTFAALGVEDDSEITLRSVVKADSAR